jgi:hypothetical protein
MVGWKEFECVPFYTKVRIVLFINTSRGYRCPCCRQWHKIKVTSDMERRCSGCTALFALLGVDDFNIGDWWLVTLSEK